jgi:hypothetical protein
MPRSRLECLIFLTLLRGAHQGGGVQGATQVLHHPLRVHGKTVQVTPTKPVLKASGTKRLKLRYDEPLTNFAFKLNMRRYGTDAKIRPQPDLDDLLGRPAMNEFRTRDKILKRVGPAT